MKLLVDHNLSPSIARSLQHLYPDHKFVALKDRFQTNISDLEWMAELDREGGWAVVTKDLRIQFRPHERLPLDRSRSFFLSYDTATRTSNQAFANLVADLLGSFDPSGESIRVPPMSHGSLPRRAR